MNTLFNKTRVGTAFSFNRPSYRIGNTMTQEKSIPNIEPNKRGGNGNREIVRHNFLSPDVRPRDAIDFDKLQAIDIETQGTKIQLSDKTIAELFKTKIPDPQDTKWIEEKNRMVNQFQAAGMSPQQIQIELNTNKPLGREQRKINATQNIGESALSTSDKLMELHQEIKEGRAESRAQQATLIGQFALVLADTNAIAGLTQLQLTNLGQSLAKIGVPTTHKRLGLEPRFVDIDFYNANTGLINLLLFSKVRESPNTIQYNYDLMVRNFAGNPATGLPAVTLRSAVAALGRRGANRRYLDLHRGGLISRNQIRAVVGGLGGVYNENFAISPAHR